MACQTAPGSWHIRLIEEPTVVQTLLWLTSPSAEYFIVWRGDDTAFHTKLKVNC
jgi:hypothetical protein